MRSLVAAVMMCGLVGTAGARVIVVEASVEILDPIRFVGATAHVTPASARMLDAIAQSLDDNPSITKLEVIAYGTDAPIGPLGQIVLGERRAKTIVNELIRRGVAPARLASTGALHPEHSNDPVPVFLIVKRSPAW